MRAIPKGRLYPCFNVIQVSSNVQGLQAQFGQPEDIVRSLSVVNLIDEPPESSDTFPDGLDIEGTVKHYLVVLRACRFVELK